MKKNGEEGCGDAPPNGTTQLFDYTGRALVKFDRAVELFHSLEQAVDGWNEERQLMAPARSPYDGDRCLEVFPPTALDEVPWDTWESTFHDGVHNLRVALDTFCFDLCHIDKAASDPGGINFPITDHPNDWPNRARHLTSMPAPLLERIRQCQPWERPDHPTPDPLRLVSKIDNLDKHRSTGVTFEVILAGQWGTAPYATPASRSRQLPRLAPHALDDDGT